MKIPQQSQTKNREMLTAYERQYRGMVKSGVHHPKDIIATRNFKSQIEDTVHTMKVLRRRLGIPSVGCEWLEQIVYENEVSA